MNKIIEMTILPLEGNVQVAAKDSDTGTVHYQLVPLSNAEAVSGVIDQDAVSFLAKIEQAIRDGALNILQAERIAHEQQLAEAIAAKDAANAKALADKDTANAQQLAQLTDQTNLQISTLRATIANMQAQIDGAAK